MTSSTKSLIWYMTTRLTILSKPLLKQLLIQICNLILLLFTHIIPLFSSIRAIHRRDQASFHQWLTFFVLMTLTDPFLSLSTARISTTSSDTSSSSSSLLLSSSSSSSSKTSSFLYNLLPTFKINLHPSIQFLLILFISRHSLYLYHELFQPHILQKYNLQDKIDTQIKNVKDSMKQQLWNIVRSMGMSAMVQVGEVVRSIQESSSFSSIVSDHGDDDEEEEEEDDASVVTFQSNASYDGSIASYTSSHVETEEDTEEEGEEEEQKSSLDHQLLLSDSHRQASQDSFQSQDDSIIHEEEEEEEEEYDDDDGEEEQISREDPEIMQEREELDSDHHSHFSQVEEDQFITKKGSTKSIQHMNEEDENDHGTSNTHDQNYDESIISNDPIAIDELQSESKDPTTTMQEKMDQTEIYMNDDKVAMLKGTPTKNDMKDSDDQDDMSYPPFTSPPIHYDSLEEELLQSDNGGDYLHHQHCDMQETTDRRETNDNDDQFITKRGIRHTNTQDESSDGNDDDDHIVGSKLFTRSPPTDSLEEVLQSETSSSLDNMLNDNNNLRTVQKDECSDLVNIDLGSSAEKKI